MRTAIVSDLHLGLTSGGDVLRDPDVRARLLAEIGDADRVVLLGDVVELRDRPLGFTLDLVHPFFEELGAALAGREVTIVPGNHDHRFAEPLLDTLSLDGERQLGLEQFGDPSPTDPGPAARLAEWLAPARLRIAYPGVWLRDDVYASHGHYMDAHLRLPRAECLLVAAMIRAGGRPFPDPAVPADYERVLRPIYGFGFGVAQVRRQPVARRRARSFEKAWEILSKEGRRGHDRSPGAVAFRTAFPGAIWGINRLLRADFDPDVTGAAIFRGGVEAAAEAARRLGLGGVHVINGHTHRPGPLAGEAAWPLPGGGSLHNTGSWVFASAFHLPGDPPNAYWPGTVTWLEDEAAPRPVRLLEDYSHADMSALVRRASLR